jgi:hypothetical protein
MEQLKDLQKRLQHNRKDSQILKAMEKLQVSPNNLDLQIDVVGLAHLERVITKQKTILWESFDIKSPIWIQSCVKRIITNNGDPIAACALLNSDVLSVLQEIKIYSPKLVIIWDTKGREEYDCCGIGLASYQKGIFSWYFYIAWRCNPEQTTVARIDYAQKIIAPNNSSESNLSCITGECLLQNWFWAELPRDFNHYDQSQHSFYYDQPYFRNPYGHTDQIIKILGLKLKISKEVLHAQ